MKKLSLEEVALWHAWKRAGEAVWSRVEAEIHGRTGLSAADFSVLSRLDDRAEPMRQQELADALGWEKSRLSHQLSRMEARDLLTRKTKGPKEVELRLARAGRAAIDEARPVHAEAVRRYLLVRLGSGARRAEFRAALERLCAD